MFNGEGSFSGGVEDSEPHETAVALRLHMEWLSTPRMRFLDEIVRS